jgi:class 3 adenylate cyclase
LAPLAVARGRLSMDKGKPASRKGKRAALLIAVALAVSAALIVVDIALIRIAQQLIEREVHNQIRALALLAGRQLAPDDIASIHTPQDMDSPAFTRVFQSLQRVRSAHPDIRYAYAFRYSGDGDLWHVIADADSVSTDHNDNGVIDPDEQAQPPGTLYRAGRSHPKMRQGLQHASIDMDPRDDPPWGTLISAYIPLRDPDGQTRAILGLDIKYEQVQEKIRAMEGAIITFSILIGVMVLYAAYLFERRSEALAQSVELQKQLEVVKAQFSKFVPENVRRELERNPDAASLQRTEMDITVMFVDIAGFTRMSERIAGDAMGALLERYFSRFLEVIHAHHGEINETAGDGLMVIFKHDPPLGHALDAVHAALKIHTAAADINASAGADVAETIRVNIGINSGTAFVGLNRFTGLSGERYTYTATGSTTNIAARVAGLAQGGEILLSQWTAQRVDKQLPLSPAGQHALKNVSQPVSVFRPLPPNTP